MPWCDVAASSSMLALKFLSSAKPVTKGTGSEPAPDLFACTSARTGSGAGAGYAPEYVAWLESSASHIVSGERPTETSYRTAGVLLDMAEQHCDAVIKSTKVATGSQEPSASSTAGARPDSDRVAIVSDEIAARGAAAGICMLRAMMAAQRATEAPMLASTGRRRSNEASFRPKTHGMASTASTPAAGSSVAELSLLRGA